MIPGVLDQEVWVAPTELAFADFVNGVYRFGGGSITVDDVINDPTADSVVPGTGLVIPHQIPNGEVYLVDDFLSLLITLDWTIVIEFELTESSVATAWIMFVGNPEDWTTDVGVYWYHLDDQYVNAYQTGDTSTDVSSQTGITAPGIYKIAFTRTNSRIAVSVNGGAVDANETDVTMPDPATHAMFGGWTPSPVSGAFNLRKVTIHAPQIDDDLPELSTL